MAVVMPRSISLSNPGKKRRRTSNPKKRMSLAQKLHFGTARQRAAARLSMKRKKNPSVRREKKAMKKAGFSRKAIRGVAKGYRSLKHRKRTRVKNVGEIVSISLAGLNPGRKKRSNTVAAKRRRKNSGTQVGRSWRSYKARGGKKRKNPGTRRRRTSSHRRKGTSMSTRRRRNPVFRIKRVRRHRNPGFGGLTTGMLGSAIGVIGGAVGSRYLTQLVLQGNNTGYMGYAGNLASAVALGYVAKKVTKNQQFGTMVMVGGLASTVLRILADKTSIGNYINLNLAGLGKGGDVGLGLITDSSFPVPQVAVPGSMNKFVTPANTRQYVNQQVASIAAATAKAPAGAAMGRVRRAVM